MHIPNSKYLILTISQPLHAQAESAFTPYLGGR